jgi:hypothetical protein
MKIKKILMKCKFDATDTYNCEVVKNLNLTVKNKLNRSGIGSFVIKVPVRKNGMTGSGFKKECHANSELLVKKYGGKVLRGYLLLLLKDNIFSLVFHSIWITPEGFAVDVTANNFADTPDFVYFIPLCLIDKNKKVGTDITTHTSIMIFEKTFRISEEKDSNAYFESIYNFKIEKLMKTYIVEVSDTFQNNEYLNLIKVQGGFRNVSTATGKAFSLL